MRQWLPDERDLDPDELYGDLRWADREPAVALGMVVGLDGGVTIAGTSGALGDEGDRAAFRALRDAADVILVGAGTVRAEGYGPPQRRPDVGVRRIAQGRSPVPRLAIVTGSLDFDLDDRIFGDPDNPPLLVTSASAPVDRVYKLDAGGAHVLQVGDDAVDLRAALAHFAGLGLTNVLCEGGPGLNTTLLDLGLVDEVFVTLAPTITGADRHLVNDDLDLPVDLELLGVVRAGSELLLRYRCDR